MLAPLPDTLQEDMGTVEGMVDKLAMEDMEATGGIGVKSK